MNRNQLRAVGDVGVETVACDLCGSTESVVIYTLRDTMHGGPGEFGLRRCTQCDLMYLSPRPTADSLALFYPPDYSPYRPAIEDERSRLMRWMRRRKLTRRRQLIEQYSGLKQGHVLDVGCATGLFLHEMAEAGWQTDGVELISSAAEFARGRLGLNVFQGTLHDAPYPAASFDVVTFWDVLEHTFSPQAELAQTADLLRSGGLVVVNVPNWNGFDRPIFGPYWQGLDAPRHLYVFTRSTLTTLLTRAGFEVLDWRCFMPGYFTVLPSMQRWLNTFSPQFARLVLRLLYLPGMRLPFEPWFGLMNGLGRGPVISAFARKSA